MGTSIIILTYNHLEKTKKCIESIKTYTKNEVYEIIVVDNNSNDDTINWLKTQSDITVIYNKENRGFPSGCNQGISEANKSYDILLLNNDTIVTNNWLTNLRKCLYSKSNICSQKKQTHIPKICSLFFLTNECSLYIMHI